MKYCGGVITLASARLGGVDDPLGSLAEAALGLALGLPDGGGGDEVHERGVLRLPGRRGGRGIVGDPDGAPHLRDGRLGGGRGGRGLLPRRRTAADDATRGLPSGRSGGGGAHGEARGAGGGGGAGEAEVVSHWGVPGGAWGRHSFAARA